MKLHHAIARAIDASPKSITAIAREVGVSRQTVYWWMTGTRTPRFSRIFELSKVLKTQLLTIEQQKYLPKCVKGG